MAGIMSPAKSPAKGPAKPRRSRPGQFRLLRWLAGIVLVILLLPYLIAPVYRFVQPVSTLMLWRWFTGARVTRVWVPTRPDGA